MSRAEEFRFLTELIKALAAAEEAIAVDFSRAACRGSAGTPRATLAQQSGITTEGRREWRERESHHW